MWLFISRSFLLTIYPAVVSQWQFLGIRHKYPGKQSRGDFQIEFIYGSFKGGVKRSALEE